MDRQAKQSRCDRRHQNNTKPKDRKRGEEDFYYRNRDYCNMLEKQVAILLYDNGIEGEYSKEYQTVDRHGNPNTRQVDFHILGDPIMVNGCSWPVQDIEVKNNSHSTRAKAQKRELLAIGVRTFTATPKIVDMWERDGLFQGKPPVAKKCPRRKKG